MKTAYSRHFNQTSRSQLSLPPCGRGSSVAIPIMLQPVEQGGPGQLQFMLCCGTGAPRQLSLHCVVKTPSSAAPPSCRKVCWLRLQAPTSSRESLPALNLQELEDGCQGAASICLCRMSSWCRKAFPATPLFLEPQCHCCGCQWHVSTVSSELVG